MIVKTMKEWLVEFGFATVFASTTPGGRVFRAKCLFCKRFGPDTGDVPGKLGDGSLADHIKSSKARSGVQRKAVIKHLKRAHALRWGEYSNLVNSVSARQEYLRARFEEDEDGNGAIVRLLGTVEEEAAKDAAKAEARALEKVKKDAKTAAAAAEADGDTKVTEADGKAKVTEADGAGGEGNDRDANAKTKTDGVDGVPGEQTAVSATEVDVVAEVEGVVSVSGDTAGGGDKTVADVLAQDGTSEPIASTTAAVEAAVTTTEPVQEEESANGGVTSTGVKVAAAAGLTMTKQTEQVDAVAVKIAKATTDSGGDPLADANGNSTTTALPPI